MLSPFKIEKTRIALWVVPFDSLTVDHRKGEGGCLMSIHYLDDFLLSLLVGKVIICEIELNMMF